MAEASLKAPTQEDTKETNRNENTLTETEGDEMELGDLDLEGLEVACSAKLPEHIPSQQVSLLEKEIIKMKTVNFLRITSESLKDPDGKKKGKKEKRGRHNNVQRIQLVGAKLVALGQYPTIDVALYPSTK